jgi:Flp pilus assembly protein TadG
MQKNLIKNEKGATMVELAIVLPILLIVLFAIAEISIALYDKAVLTNASREGARAGIVAQNPRVDDDRICQIVTDYAASYLVTFGGDNLTCDDIIITPSDPRVGILFGTDLQVSVTYQYDFLVLSRLLTALVGPITLNATTVMKFE